MKATSLALVAAFALSISCAYADDIVFENGDKLSGEITSLSEGMITLVTAAMGEIQVPLASIMTMSTSKPIKMHFRDGTVVTQRVLASDPGRIAIPEDEILESQSFMISDLSTINPAPYVLPTWTGSISANATWTSGNTETRTGSIDIDASRRTELDRISFAAQYLGGRQQNPGGGGFVTTEREISAGLKYDYFFTEKVYGWSKINAEKDGISNLDLRLIAGAGVGYQWWETKESKLSTDFGVTWFSENYSDLTGDTDYLAARIAYRFDNNIGDRSKFFSEVEWYPSFEDSKDHFVTGVIGVRTNLTESMFGVIRANIDWDSTPSNSAERTDVLYTLGVGWTF